MQTNITNIFRQAFSCFTYGFIGKIAVKNKTVFISLKEHS
ncbi:ATPase [Neisseria wadsworthii 9715]|uniref:ATPase n=1 Tax=Neisseria wadsworthii 9715 TaxID=1030841 RepID=G4CME1_9NEIS|nr:ATPase [Neisseria wadsworthii 9715]